MKTLIDMNLSPTWVSVLERAGYAAIHWSTIGAPDAPDREILEWAKRPRAIYPRSGYKSAILAATNADAPSVVQIRTQDVTPERANDFLLNALRGFGKEKLEFKKERFYLRERKRIERIKVLRSLRHMHAPLKPKKIYTE